MAEIKNVKLFYYVPTTTKGFRSLFVDVGSLVLNLGSSSVLPSKIYLCNYCPEEIQTAEETLGN